MTKKKECSMKEWVLLIFLHKTSPMYDQEERVFNERVFNETVFNERVSTFVLLISVNFF